MGSVIFADTSAIVAILLNESDARILSRALASAERRLASAAVRLETCMVLASRRDLPPLRAQEFFDAFVVRVGMIEIPIDERIGRLAVDCFDRYGKGRHAARLNFGDCLSYACAKALSAPLLYKGDDFAKTDVNVE